jgi:uncharacterized protein YllA (UPF0747 family)
VAGPGEVAYHAQLRGLYTRTGIEMPALVPRAQVALVDPPARRALQRLGVGAEEWLAMSAPERARLTASRSAHADRLAEIEARRSDLVAQIETLEQAVASFDPGLRKTVERMRSSLVGSLEKLSQQLAQSAQRRDGQIGESAARVSETLAPEGAPQERVDNLLVPHLIQHGPGLVKTLFEKIDPMRAELQVIEAT